MHGPPGQPPDRVKKPDGGGEEERLVPEEHDPRVRSEEAVEGFHGGSEADLRSPPARGDDDAARQSSARALRNGRPEESSFQFSVFSFQSEPSSSLRGLIASG